MKTILALGGAFVSLSFSIIAIFVITFLTWVLNFEFYYVCFGLGIVGVVLSSLLLIITAIKNSKRAIKKTTIPYLIILFVSLPLLIGGSANWIKLGSSTRRIGNYINCPYNSRVYNKFGKLIVDYPYDAETPIIAYDEYGTEYIVVWSRENEEVGETEEPRYDSDGDIVDWDMCPEYDVNFDIQIFDTSGACVYSNTNQYMFSYTYNIDSYYKYDHNYYYTEGSYDSDEDWYDVAEMEMKEWLSDNDYIWL